MIVRGLQHVTSIIPYIDRTTRWGSHRKPQRHLRPWDEMCLKIKVQFVNSVSTEGLQTHSSDAGKAQPTHLKWIFHFKVAFCFLSTLPEFDFIIYPLAPLVQRTFGLFFFYLILC